MNIIKYWLVGIVLFCGVGEGYATSLSLMDPNTVAIERTGLVITRNRIGIGTSLPRDAVETYGSVFMANTLTFDKVDRPPYNVDWSLGNCQRMVVTMDGPAAINLGTPPSADAHLILSIDYNTDTPGRTSFDADSSKYALVWNLGNSQNTPVSHNIDVLHFYYQRKSGSDQVSTYNGVATWGYRIPK